MRLNSRYCYNSWCHDCYIIPKEDNDLFPIKMIDLEGGFASSESEVNRFQYARKGDAFLNVFQCDTCHFGNVNKRFPNESASD